MELNLPNAHLAIVDRQKITEYLLNPAHPDNGGKAKFFLRLGFTAEQWQVFAEALRRLAASLSRSWIWWSHRTASSILSLVGLKLHLAKVQASARCGLSTKETISRGWLQLILVRRTTRDD
jgi:hypothetical protein